MGPPASDRVSRVRSYSGSTLLPVNFVYGTFTPFGLPFQTCSTIDTDCLMSVRNPDSKLPVWPLSRSLAATWKIDVSFSSYGYLDVSVPRVTFSVPMYSVQDTCALPQVGSPIRTSAGSRIFAPHRSFSQLVTSFFGSQCLGIRLMLFFT